MEACKLRNTYIWNNIFNGRLLLQHHVIIHSCYVIFLIIENELILCVKELLRNKTSLWVCLLQNEQTIRSKIYEQFESFFHNRTVSYCVRDNETVFHFSCAICKATKFLLKLVKTYEITSIGKQSISCIISPRCNNLDLRRIDTSG